MSKWKRKYKELLKMLKRSKAKHPHCMPTHLADDEAIYVAEEAYERGWSHSAYIRYLIQKDMLEKADALNLMSQAGGLPRERIDLLKHSERKERNKKA